MNIRTLIVLAVVFAFLLVLSQRTNHRATRGPAPERGVQAGQVLLPDLDVNAVTSIEVAQGTHAVTLARGEDGWRLETLHGYPADFAAVAGLLRSLPELKAGQIMHGGENELDAYALDDGPEGRRIRVTVAAAGGTERIDLGALRESGGGAPGMGLPSGRFIRVNEGPVVLVDESFETVGAGVESWYEQELTRVSPEALADIRVAGGDTGYAFVRTNGVWTALDLGDEETVVSNGLTRLTSALQFLRADTVLDPAMDDEALGLDDPVIYTAATTNGIVYTVKVGAKSEQASQATVRIEVEAPEDAGDASARRLSGWAFRVSAYQADALSLPRDQVIERKIPDPVPAAE